MPRKTLLTVLLATTLNVGCSDSDNNVPQECLDMLAGLQELKTKYPDYPRMNELTEALGSAESEMQTRWQQADDNGKQKMLADCQKANSLFQTLLQMKQ